MMVNLEEDHIFLPKSQVVGFLDPECIDVSEIDLDITTIAINAIETPPTVKQKKFEKSQSDLPSDFITSPADVTGQRLLKLCVRSILMCFLKTLVILIGPH